MVSSRGMYFEENGPEKGMPVLFIHAFPFNSRMWSGQMNAFRDRFRIITYDVRGFGLSDSGEGHWTIEEFVDDCVGVMDELKLSQAVIVGLSMGGYIALRLHERHRERVGGLVLCDTKSEADGNEAKLKRAAQVKELKLFPKERFIENFLSAAFHPETARRNPNVIAGAREIVSAAPASSIMGALIALAARTDTTPSLPSITVPTLILVGEKDELTPPSQSQSMKNHIPHSTLALIPESGHLSNLENPTFFNEALGTFLQSVPS